MVKVQRINFEKNRRILVTSDIHGGVDILKGLLKRVNYTENDYLVVIGDMIEKGPKSLETLKFIYDLSLKRDVYVTLGNNDLMLDEIKNGSSGKYLKKHYNYYLYRSSILHDFIEEFNLEIKKEEDLYSLYKLVLEKYQYLIDFVLGLPIIIESDRMLFSHAGIRNFDNLEDNDIDYCLKTSYFLKENYISPKLLFVGHFPSLGYQTRVCSYNPVRNFKKRTICVDGGYHETLEGQINLVIIENEENINIDFISDDDFCEVEVIKPQERVLGNLYIWERDNLEILSEFNDRYLVKANDKDIFELDKSFFFIYHKDDPSSFTNTDFSLERLALTEGDKVKVIRVLNDGYYIKSKGVCGFCNKDNLKVEKNLNNIIK